MPFGLSAAGSSDDAGQRADRREVVELADRPLHHDRNHVVVARDLDDAIAVATHLELDAAAVEREVDHAIDDRAGLRRVIRGGRDLGSLDVLGLVVARAEGGFAGGRTRAQQSGEEQPPHACSQS